jgi:hypothetical protein
MIAINTKGRIAGRVIINIDRKQPAHSIRNVGVCIQSFVLYIVYVCGQAIAQLNLFGCDRCWRSDKTAPQSAQDTSVKTNKRKLLYARLKHLVTFDFSCVHHFINNSIAVWRLGV